MRAYFYILALLIFSACEPRPQPEAIAEVSEEEVNEKFNELFEAFAANDVNRFASYYHEDVIRMGADGSYEVGKKAFKESVNKNYEKYYSILENYDQPRIIAGSDQVVTFSKYKELFVERSTGDTAIVVESTWIAVWQKQPEDSWKIVMTTWQP